MTHSWRSHAHRSPHGTSPPPPVRRYNPGHYTAILWPGQIKNAVGKDTGTFTDPDGNLGHYSASRIPGGHLGTAAYPGFVGGLNGTTDGPVTPGVKGLLVPYYWGDIETAKDVFDWSGLDADMNVCIQLGVQMIAMIIDRSFNNSTNPAPGIAGAGTDALRYLNQLPYNINYTLSGGGWQMSRWDSGLHGTFSVQGRYQNLINHIQARWASCPNFEGIATQETAASMTSTEQASVFYDPNDYLAGLKFEADIIKAADPRWRHFGFANYIPQGSLTQAQSDALVDQYFLYLASSGCSVCGGPDGLPDSASLQSRVYPHYESVLAQAAPNNGPIFIAWQDATFSQSIRSAQALFNWSSGAAIGAPALPGGYTANLHADYIFHNWELNNVPLNFDPDSRLIIAANPSGWNHWSP